MRKGVNKMQGAILVTVYGEKFFFEDNFTADQHKALQSLADSLHETKTLSEIESCSCEAKAVGKFVQAAHEQLGIKLNHVVISCVIRL
jgi:hypothetical protein